MEKNIKYKKWAIIIYLFLYAYAWSDIFQKMGMGTGTYPLSPKQGGALETLGTRNFLLINKKINYKNVLGDKG